jgi:F-type H+-transporting ATPase subunit delta
MSGAQLTELRAALEKRFGRKLELTMEVDTSLIGGIRAEVGDEVFDASVQAQLERMKTALTA